MWVSIAMQITDVNNYSFNILYDHDTYNYNSYMYVKFMCVLILILPCSHCSDIIVTPKEARM